MTNQTVAQALVTAEIARQNCERSGNTEWRDKWAARIKQLVNELPSGAGLDAGTTIDAIGPDKIVLLTSFHHMNEYGMYDGWTDHKITVRPAFDGLDVRISGRDRNQIKDYLHDQFHCAMSATAPER